MIVDVHTHLPTHRDTVPDSDRTSEDMMRSGDEVSMTNSIADYLCAMEPVDKTFAFGIAPRPWGSEREIIDGSGDLTDGGKNHNDVAAELHKAAPDKVIPFMSLHPMDPGMNDEYDRAVGDLGCRLFIAQCLLAFQSRRGCLSSLQNDSRAQPVHRKHRDCRKRDQRFFNWEKRR